MLEIAEIGNRQKQRFPGIVQIEKARSGEQQQHNNKNHQ